MSDRIRTVDLINAKAKELQEQKAAQPPKKTEKRFDTLHRRDINSMDFYHVGRFIHALKKVRVKDKMGIPQVIAMGEQELRLPVWYKSGDGWKLSSFRNFNREAVGITVAMMRAIERYLGIRECILIEALFNLSMISVERTTGTTGKRRYRQSCSGRLINPVDGTPFRYNPVEGIEAFVLDWKRVKEWIDKGRAKRDASAEQTGTSERSAD